MVGHLLELNPKTFVGYQQFRGQVALPLNRLIAFPYARPAKVERRRKDWSGQRRWRRPELFGAVKDGTTMRQIGKSPTHGPRVGVPKLDIIRDHTRDVFDGDGRGRCLRESGENALTLRQGRFRARGAGLHAGLVVIDGFVCDPLARVCFMQHMSGPSTAILTALSPH